MAEQLDSAYGRSISVRNEKVLQNKYTLKIIINCVRFFVLSRYDDANQYLSLTAIIMSK